MTRARASSFDRRWWALLSLAVVAAVPSWGQVSLPSAGSPVKPRVFVIFDTSTSMKQSPQFGSDGQLFADDTEADPNTPPASCRSKFCIAKSVVYDVLKVHTEEVRLGLASYFQYLVRFKPRDQRETKCWYDATLKPGFPLRFPRNGTTDVQFEGASAVGFTTLGEQELAGVASSHHRDCATTSGLHKYRLSVTSFNSTTETCAVYSYGAAPNSFTTGNPAPPGCAINKTYTTSMNFPQVGAGSFIRRVAPNVACPTLVPPAMTGTATSLSVTSAMNNTVCASASQVSCWQNWSTLGQECTASNPCAMFSSSSDGTVTNDLQSWYGFFDGDCGGGPNAGVGTAFQCINPSATWPVAATPFRAPSRQDSAVLSPFTSTVTGQTSCTGTLGVRARYADGLSRNRFIGSGDGGVGTLPWVRAQLPAPPDSGVAYDPSAGACTVDWPCDTKLVNDTPVAQPNTTSTVSNCPSPLATGASCTYQSTGVTKYQLLKTAASCPDLSGAPYSAAPGGTWNSAPACASGTGACNFVAATPSTATGTAPSCAASVRRWDGTAQATCTYGPSTFTYTAMPSVTSTVTHTLASTGTCDATGADAKNPAVYGTPTDWSGSTAQLVSCRMGATTCPLTFTGSRASTLQEPSAWTSSPSAPTGYSGAFARERAVSPAVIFDVDGPCSSYDTIVTTQNIAGVLGRFVPGPGPSHATQVGTDGESPIYKCRFAKWERQWDRPKLACDYTITGTEFTTDNTVTWCQYQLNTYSLSSPAADLHTCSYENVARRFDFTFPTMRLCPYYRMETQGTRPVNALIYSYQAKGGELAGAAFKIAAGDRTPSSVPYADFRAECPPTWDECLGAGTTCALHNSNAPAATWSSSRALRNTGRLTGFSPGLVLDLSNPANFPELTGPNIGQNLTASAIACRVSDFATPPTTEPTRTAYTSVQGPVPGTTPTYRLVSDWFDCANPDDPSTCVSNDIAALNGDPRTGTISLNPSSMSLNPRDGVAGPFQTLTTADWTNGARKENGFSGVGPAHSTPALSFLPFPADNDASGNQVGLTQLMSKCAPPTAANTSGLNWSSRGLCMPDIGTPNTLPQLMLDYTPLYGSLQNVRQYIRQSLEADSTFAASDTTCRRYFVVLATDGAENTPRNYAHERPATLPPSPDPTQLQSAVAALRSVSDGVRHVDAKTYVIGFGDALTDPGNAAALNAMAQTGGTTGAYFASDRAGLITELNNVFASILQGTYSRSKPVLSTDGRNIYASQFDRNAVSPEWKGRFFAYGIAASDGALTRRWELSESLNDSSTSDSSRNLYTDLWSASPVRQPFTEDNALVTDALDNHPAYPVGLSPARLVRFVRNPTLDEAFNQAVAPPHRESRLNAIVHAAPVVVAASTAPAWWGGQPATRSYSSFGAFQQASLERETRVLVGSSDGLLRSVREGTGDAAVDGSEGWGWVPSSLHPYVYRSMSGYTPGVDGQLAVADVCAADDGEGDAANCEVSNWKTIAITTMRGGARGMVALDVTHPEDPRPQWHYVPASDSTGTAYTTSAPVIGRVELASKEIFLALFGGGGRENGVEGPLAQEHGDEVYFLNALTGTTLQLFDGAGDMARADVWGHRNQFLARPSFWQRTGSPYMDHALFSAVNGSLYISRFRKPIQVTNGAVVVAPVVDPARWRPEVFFDPTSSATARGPGGALVQVRRVVFDTLTSTFTQVTSDGAWSGETLPLARSLPIYVRPRSAPVSDSTRLVPDYFVGTGDGLSPGDPRPEFEWNYFYAVHEGNQHEDGHSDGQPLWVNQFLHRREQVVGEPALVNGALLVATYLPAESLSPCENAGDTFLYCFNPKSGDLINCLVDSVTGAPTSVRQYSGVGIPSDLISVGSNLYWTASNLGGPPQHETIRPTKEQGDVRSWRRVQ